jgi:hypothetical protein
VCNAVTIRYFSQRLIKSAHAKRGGGVPSAITRAAFGSAIDQHKRSGHGASEGMSQIGTKLLTSNVRYDVVCSGGRRRINDAHSNRPWVKVQWQVTSLRASPCVGRTN